MPSDTDRAVAGRIEYLRYELAVRDRALEKACRVIESEMGTGAYSDIEVDARKRMPWFITAARAALDAEEDDEKR